MNSYTLLVSVAAALVALSSAAPTTERARFDWKARRNQLGDRFSAWGVEIGAFNGNGNGVGK